MSKRVNLKVIKEGDKKKKQKRKSYKHKLLYYVGSVIFFIILLEAISPLVYKVITNKSYSRTEIQTELNTVASDSLQKEDYKTTKKFMGIHVLHPYQGYVKNKEVRRKAANEFGMIGDSPLLPKRPNTINIAITGGSVANHFFTDSKDYLIKKLKEVEFFKDKTINFVCLALEGYKQPQQLMSLNYFTFLGAHYDIVINLDGYNDLVLPYSENTANKVFPFFPRSWHLYTSKSVDFNAILQLALMNELKKEQIQKAKFFSKNILPYSNFCLVLWSLLNNNTINEIRKREQELTKINKEKYTWDFQSKGPQLSIKDKNKLLGTLAQTWLKASLQMNILCQGIGVKYFHFLQPNQHVPNSKVLSDNENKTANAFNKLKGNEKYKKTTEYINATIVKESYQLLSQYGKSLKEKYNVRFSDLTNVFKKISDTVYKDACCHLNKTGNQIIADQMIQDIVAAF